MVTALTKGDCTALAVYEEVLILSLTEMIKEADRLASSSRMALPPPVPEKEYSPTRKRTPTAPCSCEDHLHNPATAVCRENCSCVKTGNFCERTCACSKFCPYRYPGCDCISGCRAKVIEVPATWDETENRPVKAHFKLQANGKEFCRCVHEERECDPDVCRSCGADVDWGSVGRKASSLTCHNQAMQRNMKKHLCVGDSEVHGRGAFLREPAKKGELLAEYTGGVISVAESNRRDAINAASKLNYLFSLGDKYAPLVDASRKGNKTRFINHGEYPDKANCFPVVKMVSGELRVGIYAARRIEAEKELFFDYGEDFTK
ncbi:histone-lysine N-methyltransferase [Spizellomyces sp. 'palustris']|nr:histone-lysine N-methyltransferase [Spizellomyces sp. 'palustris']